MPPTPRILIPGSPHNPRRIRWIVRDTTVDYTFYDVPRCLAEVLADAACEDCIDNAADYVAFGACDYSEGGGANPWLVYRQTDGKILSVDVESEGPPTLLNSSAEAFANTFSLLDPFLRQGKPLPDNLVDFVRAADTEAFEESEWRLLLEYLLAK